MIKTKWILLIVFLTGVLILMLPDEGKSIINFNKMHGPSLPDLAGLFLILLCWIGGTLLIVRNRGRIKNRLGKRNTYLLVIIYLFSCLGIIIALKIGSDWVLWPCVVIALFINMQFIAFAISKK